MALHPSIVALRWMHWANHDNNLLPPAFVNPDIVIGSKSYSLESGFEGLEALLPLPKPIIVVGMPKAGTSTIHDFFSKSGSRSVHFRTGGRIGKKKRPYSDVSDRIGNCMHNATLAGLPLLKTCGDFEVWAQIDITDPTRKGSHCFYPQITQLQRLHEEAPRATFILNRRNFTSWANSVGRWTDGMGGLAQRLASEPCQPFGPKSADQQDLIDWHVQQVQRVRQFVRDHPTHALIEVDIEDPDSGLRMEKAFHINASYWGHANVNNGKRAKKLSKKKPQASTKATKPQEGKSTKVQEQRGVRLTPSV